MNIERSFNYNAAQSDRPLYEGREHRRFSLFRTVLCSTAGLALLAGCASPYKAAKELPSGPSAYEMMDDAAHQVESQPYRVGPEDVLSVSVFFEPDLSVDSAKVDRAGSVSLPGIGSIKAEGLTTDELATSIANSLRGRLLRNPQVTVALISSTREKIVVAGQVNRPGVFDVRRDTTLVEALALASGETEIARLQDVVVYRTINGQRMAAVFNLGAIMSGQQPDLKIQGNDLVVVGYSANRAFWRDFRQTAPVFTMFRAITR